MFLVLITGCTKLNAKESSSEVKIPTGSEGLSIKLSTGKPPLETFAGKDFSFDVSIDIENKGLYTIEPGKVEAKLVGTVPATEGFIGNSDKVVRNNRDIKSVNLKDGNTDHLEMDIATLSYAPSGGMIIAEYKPNVEVAVCYPYQTKLDDNFYFGTQEEIDDMIVKSYYINPASHVQIKDFKEFRSGDKITFTFTVKKVDLNPESKTVPQCWYDGDELVEVRIESPKNAYCEGLKGNSGTVKLDESEKSLVCSVPYNKNKGYYNEPLTIRLDYYFQQNLERKVAIKRI